MKKLLSILLAFVLLLSLVTACGNNADNGVNEGGDGVDNTGTPSGDSAPVKDTLRIAFTSEPPSLSLYDHSSLISTLMNRITFNGLTRIDNATLEPVCDLAESYEVENEIEWTFKLKEGVKFHNGEEMTSADVVASLNYARALPAAALYTASMAEVEALDTYTVKITTDGPYAGLLNDLAYYYNFIVPKSLLESGHDFNAEPIGTGAYVLKEWVYGNTLTYEAFDDYFDTEHKAKIKTLVFSIIPEGSSRSMALEAGDVDFVWEVSGADVETLKANPDIYVEEIDSIDNVILFFNNDIEPWNDVNLRSAISAAINREDIIAIALNGYGKVNYSIITEGYPEYTDEGAIPYDLEKAKEYLAAWGGDPSSVTLSILCSNETRVAIGTVIQSNLAELGINVDVVPIDTASYQARWRVGDFDSVIASWSPADALSYVQRFHSDRRQTYAGAINDPYVDEMVTKMKATLDSDARAEIIKEIMAYINACAPQVSLYQSKWFRAYNQNLGGVLCSTTGYACFNDMYWK